MTEYTWKSGFKEFNLTKGFNFYDDVIKWKHFPYYLPFVRAIHWSPMDSPHKGQWREALMFLWSAPEQKVEQTIEMLVIWDTHLAHYDVTVMDCPRRSMSLLVKIYSIVNYGNHWYSILTPTMAGVYYLYLPANHKHLTHWGRNKMAASLQSIFLNAFSCMKMFVFWFKSFWS